MQALWPLVCEIKMTDHNKLIQNYYSVDKDGKILAQRQDIDRDMRNYYKNSNISNHITILVPHIWMQQRLSVTFLLMH